MKTNTRVEKTTEDLQQFHVVKQKNTDTQVRAKMQNCNKEWVKNITTKYSFSCLPRSVHKKIMQNKNDKHTKSAKRCAEKPLKISERNKIK